MHTQNTVKSSSESSGKLGLGSGKSVKARVSEDRPLDFTDPADGHPDGGFAAWCVVLGSTCAIFATYGLVTSWGVFQSYYQRVLIPETPTSMIAMIGSIQSTLSFLPGLVAGRLCDLGYFKHTLFIFSAFMVTAIALTGQCQEFWQLLLCHGIMVGTCCGMIVSPIPAVISQWFKKRRSLALGIVSVGTSLGGTIIPIAVRSLIELVGFKWTMRIVALTELFALTIANLTLRRRIEPPKRTEPFFAWHDFKKPAFAVYTLGGIVNFLGFYTPMAFIDLSATWVGISPGFSFYLVSIANAGSGVGRICSGILADEFGVLTVTGPLTLLCAVMTYLWPFVTTKGGLVAIATVYGFCSGAYSSLLAVPVVMMGDMYDSGRRTGSFLTCIAIGAAAGPPISGAIAQATDGFRAVGYYAGSCILGAVVFLYLTKYMVIGSLHGKF